MKHIKKIKIAQIKNNPKATQLMGSGKMTALAAAGCLGKNHCPEID